VSFGYPKTFPKGITYNTKNILLDAWEHPDQLLIELIIDGIVLISVLMVTEKSLYIYPITSPL